MDHPKEIGNKTWPDLINESVYTSDDIDIGDIYAINRDFIVVKRGFINIHYYYIPIIHVEGWDNNVLWLNISEDKVKTKYERNYIHPDPSRYYVKDHDMQNISFLSELKMIPSKITEPAYSFDIPVTTTTNTNNPVESDMHKKLSSDFICDLCNKNNFNSKDELSNHIKTLH
jgi:hypothetical protein